MPNFNEANMDVMGDDDDDEALEAELKLMQQDVDSPASKRSKANQKKSGWLMMPSICDEKFSFTMINYGVLKEKYTLEQLFIGRIF